MAKAYGVPAIGVDGNDVLAVYDAAVEGVARARAGGGPTIIVAETYRMLGHAQHDAQPYVPEAELEEWRGRDPIVRYERYLADQGLANPDSLRRIRGEVDRVLDRAVEEALAAPMPVPGDARTRVYAPAEPDVTPWTRTAPAGYPELDVLAGSRSSVEA